MEETVVVVMIKDEKTGFLDKEIASYKIPQYDDLIFNIFAEKEKEDIFIHMKIFTGKDVENWKFNAIYDYYEQNIFEHEGLIIKEDEESFNPTWELIFPFDDDDYKMEEKIYKILQLHKQELEDVYEVIKDKKEEYTNE